MRVREGERALALSALVDETVAPAVRAAALAAAEEAASKAVSDASMIDPMRAA
jgi:hypothetical protein